MRCASGIVVAVRFQGCVAQRVGGESVDGSEVWKMLWLDKYARDSLFTANF